ncbi:LCP family protein [Streptomyces sp. NPDC002454]
MDTQGRDRADGIDPADQWVKNPRTGEYELRLPSDPASPAEAPDGASPAGGRARPRPRRENRPVPAQRTRRAVSSPAGKRVDGTTRADRRKRKSAGGKKSGTRKALLWTGGVTAFVVVVAGVGGYLVYERLNGNIDAVDVGDAAEGGSLKDGPLNILLLGIDKRSGKGNTGYGDRKNSSGHADTTLLLHVSEDRSNATAVSIPRDLKVDIPDCPTKQSDGTEKVIPGVLDRRFNESFGVAGRDPGCTMRTVKEIAGVPIHHFMMADFNAVKELTRAIGGVDVCLAKPIKDDESKLDLSVGPHTVQGEQALAFVRNRHGLGNESDLDRIKMQQQFVASMIRKMKDEVLGDAKRMFDLADAATKALTVNKEIGDVPKLTELAREIGKINVKNITFTTVPVRDNPAEIVKATVVLDETRAPQMFSMLQNDVSFTEVKRKKKAAKSKQDALLKGPRAPADQVRVDVFNGSDTRGAAQRTLDWLQNTKGVAKSTNRSNAPQKQPKTTLAFGANQIEQARTLADYLGLPAAGLRPDTADADPMEPMALVLGADFKGPGVPITGPTKAPEGVQRVEADKKVCAQ